MDDERFYVLVDGQWENDDGPKGWHAVADEGQGIIAYFASVVDADNWCDECNKRHSPEKNPHEGVHPMEALNRMNDDANKKS